MPLVVLDIECLEGKIVKELGIFKEGIVLGYSFLPPKDYKPTFQAKWNTKNMHGTNWNHGKLDYSELAFIVHQHCSPTKEYFAKGLEKCKILFSYLCKDVENLDDLGCPKASKLLENDDAEWNCSNYPYPHKKTLHCAEKKAYVYVIWTWSFFDNI